MEDRHSHQIEPGDKTATHSASSTKAATDNPVIRTALDAYAAAAQTSGDDSYLIWDLLWRLMDHCDETGVDFDSIVRSARSERSRILSKTVISNTPLIQLVPNHPPAPSLTIKASDIRAGDRIILDGHAMDVDMTGPSGAWRGSCIVFPVGYDKGISLNHDQEVEIVRIGLRA